MMKTKLSRELVGLAGASVVLVAGYTYIIRPWTRSWGATNVEVRSTLPGDDIVPKPRYLTTHAVSIRASAAEIWPWLIQMGQDRGGLYSYDWLENAIGCDIHSTNQIIPAYQHLALGDAVRLTSAPDRSRHLLQRRYRSVMHSRL